MHPGAEKCSPHALLVPFSAQGHVSGCMLLARSLAEHGFKVTFVYFSSYYAKLKASNQLVLPTCKSSHVMEGRDDLSPHHMSNGSCNVSEAAGDDNSSHPAASTISSGNGLVEVRVVEDGFLPGDVDKLFLVTSAMKENLLNLILELQDRGTPPTCLVGDCFVPWTAQVSEHAGIPQINFWSSSALAYITAVHLPPLYSQGIFPETGSSTQWKRETPLMLDNIPGLPPFSSELYPTDIRFGDLTHPFVAFFGEVAACSKFGERILIHTMEEIEPDAFHALQVAGVSAYGTGPLLHYTEKSCESGSPGLSQGGQLDSISWLNTQADSSVIYIAFGSFASLSVVEIQELAAGLEASGSPFLWAIREDLLGGAELTQVLSKGFKERTSERGMITGWAPQVEVLAHKAIGGFLTHCGWNSALESLWEGVPMLCCARVADQRMNSHYLCDVWGVGLELERTDTGGLEREYVEIGVKALMQEDVGFKAREKAQAMKQLARKTCQPGQNSFSNLQKFYKDMKALCNNPASHMMSRLSLTNK